MKIRPFRQLFLGPPALFSAHADSQSDSTKHVGAETLFFYLCHVQLESKKVIANHSRSAVLFRQLLFAAEKRIKRNALSELRGVVKRRHNIIVSLLTAEGGGRID